MAASEDWKLLFRALFLQDLTQQIRGQGTVGRSKIVQKASSPIAIIILAHLIKDLRRQFHVSFAPCKFERSQKAPLAPLGLPGSQHPAAQEQESGIGRALGQTSGGYRICEL